MHTEYRPLVPLFAALIAGVTFDRYVISRDSVECVWTEVPPEPGMFRDGYGMVFWCVFLAAAFLTWLFFYLRSRRRSQKEPGMERSAISGPDGSGLRSSTWSADCASLHPRLFLFALLAGFTALGGLWHHLYWNFYPSTEIGLRVDEGLTLSRVEAVVMRPPRKITLVEESFFAKIRTPAATSEKETPEERISTTLDVRVLRTKEADAWKPASGHLVVRVSGDLTDVHAGDRVILSGKLIKPSPAMNPGGFAADVHYRNERVLAILRLPSVGNVEVVSRPRVWGLFRVVEYLQAAGKKHLEKRLSAEQTPLAQALLLGCREEVSPEENQMMLETGTIHLLAVSGLHIGILGGGFLFTLRILGFRKRQITLPVLIVVVLYVLVTGARPPAVRAGILIGITVLAYSRNRIPSQMNTLAAAGIAVLAYNPTAFFSVGTQLSFLAVAALVNTPMLNPGFLPGKIQPGKARNRKHDFLELWLAKKEHRGDIFRGILLSWGVKFGNVFFSSVVMMLVLMPLIAGRFHVIAIIGILLNVLIWPPLFVTMISGVCVLFFSWILPPAGSFFGMICTGSLRFMEWMIATGAGVPNHCLWTSGFPAWWMAGFYLMLFLWMQMPEYRPSRRVSYAVMGIWLTLGFFIVGVEKSGRPAPAAPASSVNARNVSRTDFRRDAGGEFRCSFISVSHGLSILMEFPDGRNFLYDAGQFSSAAYPVRTITEFLWSRGVTRLDGIFLSHPDMDHFNAVPGILERFPVGRLYVSPSMFLTVETEEDFSEDDFRPEDMLPDAVDAEIDVSPGKTPIQLYYEQRRLREAPDRPLLDEFYREVKRRGVPITKIHAGTRLEFSKDCVMDVLHPPADDLPKNNNAGSLVILVKYRDFRFLLTGDLAPPGMQEVTRTPVLERCDVMLSPHHGGKTCNTPELAFWSRPGHLVIAESPAYPQKQTEGIFQNFGAKVHHTGISGAVIFVVRGDELAVVRRSDAFLRD